MLIIIGIVVFLTLKKKPSTPATKQPINTTITKTPTTLDSVPTDQALKHVGSLVWTIIGGKAVGYDGATRKEAKRIDLTQTFADAIIIDAVDPYILVKGFVNDQYGLVNTTKETVQPLSEKLISVRLINNKQLIAQKEVDDAHSTINLSTVGEKTSKEILNWDSSFALAFYPIDDTHVYMFEAPTDVANSTVYTLDLTSGKSAIAYENLATDIVLSADKSKMYYNYVEGKFIKTGFINRANGEKKKIDANVPVSLLVWGKGSIVYGIWQTNDISLVRIDGTTLTPLGQKMYTSITSLTFLPPNTLLVVTDTGVERISVKE